VRVRGYTLKDLPDVIRIERASFGPDSYSITTFLAHVFRDRKGLIVAEDEDRRIVGYALARVGVRWFGIRRGGITSIAVDPSHRRRGFGQALLTSAIEYLQESEVDEADLEVNVANRAAQSLYESFGFVQTKMLPHYYGPNQDGVKMILDMGRQMARATGATRSSNG